MNRNDHDGEDDSGQPDVSIQDKTRRLIVRANDRRRRERAVMQDRAAILNSEELVTLHENAADLREGIATLRDREIRGATTKQSASDDHMIMLQQANAHLVIAAIRAHKQAEQSES